MLDDVLEATSRVCAHEGWELRVAVQPPAPEALAEMGARAPCGAVLVAQCGPDLASRMSTAIAQAAAAGFERIVLRGSDSPALPPEQLVEAARDLDHHDVVMGPDVDGGYNLIAVTRPWRGLIDHPMSTTSVADDTLEAAARLGLRTRRLVSSFYLDTAGDLLRLRDWMAAGGDTDRCRRTRALLDRESWWPGS